MYVVYVCALMFLFKSVVITKILWLNTLICAVVIKAATIVTDIYQYKSLLPYKF